MRGAIIITVIVVGGLLVAAPLIAEYLTNANHQDNVVRLLQKPGTSSVNLHFDPLPAGAEVACGVAGALVLIAGLIMAFRELRTVPLPTRLSRDRDDRESDDRE
jgi:fructose-specific phosphotransferase system IIC component